MLLDRLVARVRSILASCWGFTKLKIVIAFLQVGVVTMFLPVPFSPWAWAWWHALDLPHPIPSHESHLDSCFFRVCTPFPLADYHHYCS